MERNDNSLPRRKPEKEEEVKPPFITLNRIIGLLAVLLVVIVLSFMIYSFGGGLQLLVSSTTTRTDAFRDYDVVKQISKNYYAVEFRDLITSAGGMKKRYYRYDLTIETQDKNSTEDIVDTRKSVIALINGVMSTFPPEEMNTEPERNRVKTIMEQEISGKYPNVKIKGIYFTNFLYD
ncbi:MAG: hypothetical protein C0602_07055 [Denitrovibrio sp.]|nr:MAG: hypothetical protein C0602_07055 [Denitrovibrio sp.]